MAEKDCTQEFKLALEEEDDEHNAVLAPTDDYAGTYFTIMGRGDKQNEVARRIQTAVNQHSSLLRCAEALRVTLDNWVSLANSGDAGNWNPEEEAHVIEAREALSSLEKSNG